MAKDFGLVQVIWGNGKGKTTAALGQGFRAAGHGFKVHMVQFMKAGIEGNSDFDEYGEITAIKKFPNFTYERFGFKEWFTENKDIKPHRKEVDEALSAAKKALTSDFDVVILDEILYAATMGILTEDEVIELINQKNKNTELILTGGHKPIEKIFERADYISHIEKQKHPYDKGTQARVGTEF